MNTAPQIPIRTSDQDGVSSPALDMAQGLAKVMATVQNLPLRDKDRALFDGTDPFRFGPDQSRQAWSVGQGPVVVLVHGYTGRGVQMATLAHRIAQAGFQAVFFDAGGHGVSEPEPVGFHTFIRDTSAIVQALGTDIHALIGHSAGALGMMRSRGMLGVTARKYGVISAPLFPYVPLERMRATGVPEEALDHVKAILSTQFDLTWTALAKGQSFAPQDGADLLMIYDRDDDRVRHGDADTIAGLWPAAQVLKTDGLGHNRILQAEQTIQAMLAFLTT